MKKKIGITIGAVIIAAVLGVGIYHSNASKQSPELSMDDIKQLVADQYPGKITELELDKHGEKSVYELEILNKDKEYDLKLDGDTGEVLSLEERAFLNNTESKSNNHSNGKTKNDTKSSDKTGQSTDKTAISDDEAKKIALKELDGTITSLELDEDDGRLKYEIEIHSKNKEADIEVDAYTGEVIVISTETEDDNDDDADDSDNDD